MTTKNSVFSGIEIGYEITSSKRKAYFTIDGESYVLGLSVGNRKMKETAQYTGRFTSALDLPAGFTCPAADICLAKANRESGKIVRGKHNQVLCFQAKIESYASSVRRFRWSNLHAIKAMLKVSGMLAHVLSELQPTDSNLRWHASGDIFNQTYLVEFEKFVAARPDVKVFGYSKVAAAVKYITDKNYPNWRFVFSHGSTQDAAAASLNLPQCYIVKDAAAAAAMGLPVACPTTTAANDYDYIMRGESFCLKLH